MENSSVHSAISNPILEGTGIKNFMDGVSFKLTPLQRLRFIATSAIRGEPSYYRMGKSKDFAQNMPEEYLWGLLFPELREKTVADIFDETVLQSIETDFWGTVEFALECRQKYFMRLNPQIILMMASMHPKRVIESEKKENFGRFRKIICDVAERPDDLTSQLNFYKEKNGGKNKLPGIIKRAWADRLEKLTRYQANKYKNDCLIDLIRLSHPKGKKNPVIDELVKTGKVEVNETEMTWEQLRSQGKSWIEIVNQLGRLPHMAALRNLVGMASETKDEKFMTKIMNDIKGGVTHGKQFPFRYFSAYLALNPEFASKGSGRDFSYINREKKHDDNKSENIPQNIKILLNKGLEECLHISMQNFPKLNGDTISLCDNSGSAWGAVTSEYGSMQCAVIANLSGLITAYNCTGIGYVGVFGDSLDIYKVNKTKLLLEQLVEINKLGSNVGGGTENGIWIFFREALEKKTK